MKSGNLVDGPVLYNVMVKKKERYPGNPPDTDNLFYIDNRF